MFKKVFLTLLILGGMIYFAACNSLQTGPTPAANMPNPASVHCEQNGGKLDLRQDASGGVAGVCVFPDGSECDEWAYLRGECKPGVVPVKVFPTTVPTKMNPVPSVSPELDSDGWKIYRSETSGYSFRYPADAAIIEDDDPLKSISIVGPLAGGDHWPQITISHPKDQEDYRPPAGTDLVKWLTDHYLLADERLSDTRIAGTTAIHTRHARSPQSYAYDRYYFARAGQLYMIVIGHTADKEDWKLYNRFLDSIQFT